MGEEPFYKQPTLLDITAAKEPPLPEKIGPYVIEALIAKSHYSIIYLGYHPENRQVVALKVLSPEFVQKKAMISSFLNEGTIIQMAAHPNIVKLFAQGQWEGGLYLAMEFIRGVSLRQFIQQHSLSLKRCLDIVLQVSYALCHLHAHGIIHGDLKPENILITEDGEVKVLDFGIAKLHNHSPTTLSLAGTPSYMSPEHKISVQNLTYSSDIYALGIIAYELITGKLSFGVVHLDQIPKPLRPLIEKCLKKSLLERYSDVVDLIHDLSEFFKKELAQEKLPESSPLETDLLLNLQATFPLPQLSLEPLDFGFSRNPQAVHPFLSHLFDDGSLIVGLIQGHAEGMRQPLTESIIWGQIYCLLQNLNAKSFVFDDFCQKLNLLCYQTKILCDFSFVYLDAYLDEIHLCYGGLLAPLLSRNQKLYTPPTGLINAPLGSSTQTLSLATHAFNAGDQFLIHNLTTSLEELAKHYQPISSYSSQSLTDTLIKKMSPSALSSLIGCLKVK